MLDQGTAIELSRPGEVDRAGAGKGASGAELVEVVPAAPVISVRERHARRAELTSRVLSLLVDVGSLALRILERRVNETGRPDTMSSGSPVTRAADAALSGKYLPRNPVDMGRGRGGQRQRQRRRGAR